MKETTSVLSVKVVPNARKNEVVGWEEENLKIRIHAPPDKNKANRELIRFLADLLSLSSSQIDLLSGHGSRKKLIRIPLSEQELKRRLSSIK